MNAPDFLKSIVSVINISTKINYLKENILIYLDVSPDESTRFTGVRHTVLGEV